MFAAHVAHDRAGQFGGDSPFEQMGHSGAVAPVSHRTPAGCMVAAESHANGRGVATIGSERPAAHAVGPVVVGLRVGDASIVGPIGFEHEGKDTLSVAGKLAESVKRSRGVEPYVLAVQAGYEQHV